LHLRRPPGVRPRLRLQKLIRPRELLTRIPYSPSDTLSSDNLTVASNPSRALRGVMPSILHAPRGEILVSNDEQAFRVFSFRRLLTVEGPGDDGLKIMPAPRDYSRGTPSNSHDFFSRSCLESHEERTLQSRSTSSAFMAAGCLERYRFRYPMLVTVMPLTGLLTST